MCRHHQPTQQRLGRVQLELRAELQQRRDPLPQGLVRRGRGPGRGQKGSHRGREELRGGGGQPRAGRRGGVSRVLPQRGDPVHEPGQHPQHPQEFPGPAITVPCSARPDLLVPGPGLDQVAAPHVRAAEGVCQMCDCPPGNKLILHYEGIFLCFPLQ